MAIDILTLAAARAGKGGGGSASKYKQPDWGSEVAMVDVLPEATYEWVNEEESFALIKNDFKLTSGKKYTVEYNGTTYSCTARYEPAPSEAPKEFLNVCLGRLYDLDDTVIGEEFPFSIYAYSEQMAEMQNAYGEISVFDGANPFTISIQGEDEIYHKIPGEYVGGVGKYKQPEWGIDENGAILPEAALEIDQDAGGFVVRTWGDQYLEGGKTYTVKYNGAEYGCVCSEIDMGGMGGYLLGNGAVLGLDVPASDAPFMFMLNTPETANATGYAALVVPLDGSGTCTIEITGEMVRKIPAEYVAGGGILFVNFTLISYNSNTFELDTSFDDIYKAIMNGRQLYACSPADNAYSTVASFDPLAITFVKYSYQDGSVQLTVYKYNNDNTGEFSIHTFDK